MRVSTMALARPESSCWAVEALVGLAALGLIMRVWRRTAI